MNIDDAIKVIDSLIDTVYPVEGLLAWQTIKNTTLSMVPCQSHKCFMCCPVGDEFCPKEPCLIHRIYSLQQTHDGNAVKS